MKVKFEYTDDKTFDRYHYQSDSVGDASSEYYPAADVEQLVTAAKRALPFCDASYQSIELREALAPFVEGK